MKAVAIMLRPRVADLLFRHERPSAGASGRTVAANPAGDRPTTKD
jgi:hypothetical protein